MLKHFVLARTGATGVVPYSGHLSPWLLAMLSAFPFMRLGYRPFISRRGRALGLALAKPRRETDQIDLAWLLVRPVGRDGPKVRAPRDVVSELLDAVCRCSAEAGIVSVFARLPEGCGFVEEFSQYGFIVVAREHTYGLTANGSPAPVEVEGLRPQEKSDAWGVQQLYRSFTPVAVQRAENLTSRTWELPKRRGLGLGGGDGRYESFVVDGKNGIDAWLRIESEDGAPCRIGLMVNPSRRGLAPEMIDFALEWLSNVPGPNAVTTVRDYEAGLLKGLEESGFRPTHSRLLMVKHLGIRFKGPMAEPALERVGS